MRFTGKQAVVTGGASGIGRATAERLADEGASVLVGDIDEVAGVKLAESSAGRIEFLHCDVTKVEDIRALVDAADTRGGLDLMFNNAGAGGSNAPIDEIEADDWDRTQALLLRSIVMGIRYAAPLMAKRGGGAIVNTASIAGLQAGGLMGYSMAKAGVLHLSKVAAADLARFNIRVNAVAPGFILTDIFVRHLAVSEDKILLANNFLEQAAAQAQPVKRAGRPEDVAAAVAFLLSEEASFINGTHLIVDGGITIGGRDSWDPQTPDILDTLREFL